MDTPASPVAPVAPAIEKPRRFKWLRICWTAVFVMLAVGLLPLWVRSYWWVDWLIGPLPGAIEVQLISEEGRLAAVGTIGALREGAQSWTLIAFEPGNRLQTIVNPTDLGFSIKHESEGIALFAPHWFAILISAALAYFPWLPWSRYRFSYSLKTMLIAVYSALPGLVAWLVRR